MTTPNHILYQTTRPSGHSYFILMSHISFIFSVATSLRKGLVLESISLLLSALISINYHFCDENLHCTLGLDIFQWHALDVWATFFLICFVLGVMIFDFENKWYQLCCRFVYFVLLTGFVWYDRGSVLLFGGLLASVTILILFRYGWQKHHLKLPSPAALYTGNQRSSNALLRPRRDPKNLVLGLAVFSLSLGCFVLANTPIIGDPTYVPEKHGPVKPMDIPDTSVYWFFHSVWHFCSALSAYFILQFLKPKERRG